MVVPCTPMRAMIAVTRERHRAQVPHTAHWLLAAGGVDPLGVRCATVELGSAGWAQPRRLTIPVLIGRDFFCRRFHILTSSAFHPNPPDQTTEYPNVTLVTPPAIPIPPSDRLSSLLQPGTLPSSPIQLRSHPKHRDPPVSSSVPGLSSVISILVHPSATYTHTYSTKHKPALQLTFWVTLRLQHLLHLSAPSLNIWPIFKSSFHCHCRRILPTRDLRLHFDHLHHRDNTQPQQRTAHLQHPTYNHFCNLIGACSIDRY